MKITFSRKFDCHVGLLEAGDPNVGSIPCFTQEEVDRLTKEKIPDDIIRKVMSLKLIFDIRPEEWSIERTRNSSGEDVFSVQQNVADQGKLRIDKDGNQECLPPMSESEEGDIKECTEEIND